MTSEDDWKSVVEATVECYGRVDGLVNNVGIAARAPLESETLEQFERVLKVNRGPGRDLPPDDHGA
ncbi:hypothetical protein GCM10022224_056850 [Nonomuraea antimicrobica]|uniref:3-oxoacyl-[acyl-carrier protein] reductase n=1 Tax=Nonomuraea antimicrobica TaxID=561173 RepID=A0ABP7CDX7_9ACTN